MKRRASYLKIFERIGIPLATIVGGVLAAVSSRNGWFSDTQRQVFTVFAVLCLLLFVRWADSRYFIRRLHERERDRARAQQEVETLQRLLAEEPARQEAALRAQADDFERRRAKVQKESDRALAERERELTELDEELRGLGKKLAERERELTERGKEVAELQRGLAERGRQLAELEKEFAKRSDALAEVARCQMTYEQELVITVIIGLSDDQDQVREDVRMKPDPWVVYKIVRPIVPTYLKKLVRLADINFTVAVENGDGGRIHVEPTALEEEEDFLLVGLRFRPVLTKFTKWQMAYRPTALWRPFRESGVDTLAWDNRMRNNLGGKCPLIKFAVRFVFLDRDCNPNVVETGDRGAVERSRNENGEWVIEWCDQNPGPFRYEWSIVGSPGATGRTLSVA
jgi:hypothetical protein